MPNFTLHQLSGNNFTDAERESCLPLIETFVSLSNAVKLAGFTALGEKANTTPYNEVIQAGFSVLEDHAQQTDDPFLKAGLLLIADGADTEYIIKILQQAIASEQQRLPGKQLLERLMILEGLLTVQKGLNPHLVKMILASMLGVKYM